MKKRSWLIFFYKVKDLLSGEMLLHVGSHAVQNRVREGEAPQPLHHQLRPGVRGPWGVSIPAGWMLFVLTWQWGWCNIFVWLKYCRRRTF